MPIDWSRLEHAYGSAADVPQLFEQVGDPDMAEEGWDGLFSSLCHQGTVYPASFAALPVLADIATGRRPGDRQAALALAGGIVAGERHLHQPGHVRAHYPQALAELHRMAQHYLTEEPFEDVGSDYLYLLETLLAFEGVPVWSEDLHRGLHDVECPSCLQSLEIDLFHRPPGTYRRDPHATVRLVNMKGPTLTGVYPAAPPDLKPLASRLYRMAAEAGQPAAAEHLTFLFGRATCPDCGRDFSVAAQVEAFRESRS